MGASRSVHLIGRLQNGVAESGRAAAGYATTSGNATVSTSSMMLA